MVRTELEGLEEDEEPLKVLMAVGELLGVTVTVVKLTLELVADSALPDDCEDVEALREAVAEASPDKEDKVEDLEEAVTVTVV